MRVDRGGRWQKKPEMRQTAEQVKKEKRHNNEGFFLGTFLW